MDRDRVLIVTDKNEHSVPKVMQRLKEIDQPFFRLDVASFVESGSYINLGMEQGFLKGYIKNQDGEAIEIESIKSVWLRRPRVIVVPGHMSELEKRFIDDEFTSTFWSMYTCLDQAYWINNPLYAKHLLEHNKLLQIKLAKRSGLLVPDTIVTNDPECALSFCEEHKEEVAIKAVRSRLFEEPGEGTSGIYTNKVTGDFLRQHSEEIKLAPIMFQEYVQKKLEFRITVVGEKVLSCVIHSQDSERTKYDWRRYDFDNVRHEIYDLPKDIVESILQFMSDCKLTFGAIDMILTPDGKYVFLEVNPNGQFGWIENLTGLPISRTIAELLANPPLKRVIKMTLLFFD